MHVLIIADIEGSSGCRSKSAAAFMTQAWRRACFDMTADAAAVVAALKEAGVSKITVQDFHRTGFNIIADRMPSGCRLVSGYQAGPVPGIGDPQDASALMMIGMHAPSGGGGFLPHTLTSRVASLRVNGRLLSEAQLFSAAVYDYGIRPLFFSGCPVACRQAKAQIPGLITYAIDKSGRKAQFEKQAWRKGLAHAAAAALSQADARPYNLTGPFAVRMQMRDGPPAAAKPARRWNLNHNGAGLFFECRSFAELYDKLLCICYLTPFPARHRQAALLLYRLWGAAGQLWVRSLRPIPAALVTI